MTGSREEAVAMRITDTSHFQLDTEEGISEFAGLLPSGGHLVHTTSETGDIEVQTVTLFHQLKCLDIIRQELTQLPSPPSPKLVDHCMNYLRQTILCKPSLLLEETFSVLAMPSHAGYDVACRDWEAIYEEADRNYGLYTSRTEMHST